MTDMFEGTKEQQIERQVEYLRSALHSDGTRVYPEGYAFSAFWKNEDEVIQYEIVKL